MFLIQKGFAPIVLLLIIVGAIAIGGGAYYYQLEIPQNKESITPPVETPTQETKTTEDSSTMKKEDKQEVTTTKTPEKKTDQKQSQQKPTPPPPPSCTGDIWKCGDWSGCSSEGSQSRTCSLQFDCEVVSTPSPTIQQSCTPPFSLGGGFKKSSSGKNIKVDIIVDTDSFSISDSDLDEFFRRANNWLVIRTDTEMNLLNIRKLSYSQTNPPCTGCIAVETEAFGLLTQVYKDTAVNQIPEYVILLRKDTLSSTVGGYIDGGSIGTNINSSFRNRYPSPKWTGHRIYTGILNWDHMFGACGYDRSDPKNPKYVSNTAINGECQNNTGVSCVMNQSLRYYQCNQENFLQSFYAQHKLNFMAASAVHELMHPFGSKISISEDHFGAGCRNKVEGIDYNDFFSTGQQYTDICPDLFDIFVNKYTP